MDSNKTQLLANTITFGHMARLTMFFVIFLSLQIVHVLQKPFVDPRFATGINIVFAFFFLSEIFKYFQKDKNSKFEMLFQLGVLFFIFYFASSWSSFFLFSIVTFLFIAGLESEIEFSFMLAVSASLLYSLLNALEFKQVGLQNNLSVILFNVSFISSAIAGSFIRANQIGLKENLVRTEKKLRTKAELASTLLSQMPLEVFALTQHKKILLSNLSDPTSSKALDFIRENLDLSQNYRLKDVVFYDSVSRSQKFYSLDTAEYYDSDIDEKIKLVLLNDQTEKIKLLDQLKQKEKLSAIGQLAAGIAHEIRNPLAGISGSIELLSKETNNSDDKKLMAIVLREIDRLNNLITEFLDYAKPEKRPDQPVDLSFILGEVIENIKMHPLAVQNKVEFQIALISKIKILGFSEKLKQAFLNIMVNALQAMSTAQVKILEITMIDKPDSVQVRIKDSGLGMTEAIKQRIFEPFFTTKSKGTGLGLALTQKILENHFCVIDVDSNERNGTGFNLIFKKVIL